MVYKYHRSDPVGGFWLRVNKDGPVPQHRPELGRCWVWTGKVTRRGYVHLKFHGLYRYGHVVSWFLATGDWPGHMRTLHKCDNPSCVNPGHLFLGTPGDNNADRDSKGRQARGSRHAAAKLTEAVVAQIRAERSNGATQVELAHRHGISRRAVRRIIDGSGWRHC